MKSTEIQEFKKIKKKKAYEGIEPSAPRSSKVLG